MAEASYADFLKWLDLEYAKGDDPVRAKVAKDYGSHRRHEPTDEERREADRAFRRYPCCDSDARPLNAADFGGEEFLLVEAAMTTGTGWAITTDTERPWHRSGAVRR